jgi:hypothetical protein
MSEEIVCCWKCGMKCCKSTLYKTGGKCPKTTCNTVIDPTLNAQLKAAGATNA